MFKFGKRTVVKQGGSFMIALPIQWMKSWDSDLKSVMIEMDSENHLRIMACDTCPETPVC